MRLHSVVLGLCVSAVVTLHGGQARGVSAGMDASRAADLAAIEKLRQQDIAATIVARSCCADGFLDR